MCAIVASSNPELGRKALGLLLHRGPDGTGEFVTSRGTAYLGHARLACVGGEESSQPVGTPTGSVLIFNGELYNWRSLAASISEGDALAQATDRFGSEVWRFLDGYYTLAQYRPGSNTILVGRDPIGVVPLFYSTKGGEFLCASERKAFEGFASPKEVLAGEWLTWSASSRKIVKRGGPYSCLPWLLLSNEYSLDSVERLFLSAVKKRVDHCNEKVTLALSGGVDSNLIAYSLKKLNLIHRVACAVTVVKTTDSSEYQNVERVTAELGLPLITVLLTPELMERHSVSLLRAADGPIACNPVKFRGLVRNYFVAMHAPTRVILCGEGGDELGCSYPPFVPLEGLEIEHKAFSMFRSQASMTLDRTNKGGLAWGREYRLPFLDMALVQEMMSTRKLKGKVIYRELAQRLGVPSYVLDKPKYIPEEEGLK